MVKFTSPAWRFVGHLANRTRIDKWGSQRWLAVLFHHITNGSNWTADDPLICGLHVDISVEAFKSRIDWLANRYEIVSLDWVLGFRPSRTKRPKVLICFDDGYRSVLELAAPILKDSGIPWCLFINPASVGNSLLPVDNIVAYIVNRCGAEALSNIVGREVRSAPEFINKHLSHKAPSERRTIVESLAASFGIETARLARSSNLYVDEREIRTLANSGVEIGNHTFDHVHCRTISSQSAKFQIEHSAAEVEKMSGRPVRAFAYPYGSIADATPVARQAIKNSGHRCAFLVHNRANLKGTDRYGLYRVDLGEMDDVSAVLELEVLPRIREVLFHAGAISGH